MTVHRFRKKSVSNIEITYAARYTPGEDTEPLHEVANMTGDAEVREVHFLRETVLVVRYSTEGERQYEVVDAGQWLAFSEASSMLYDTDSKDLMFFYEALNDLGEVIPAYAHSDTGSSFHRHSKTQRGFDHHTHTYGDVPHSHDGDTIQTELNIDLT